MSDIQPNRLGKYEILAEIGKGGFATVCRARDHDLGRDVALKVLDPLLMRDPAWVARFRQEARLIAALDHPCIVPIYEIGQAEGILFIAMKLLESGSLADRIAKGPLPWAEVVRLTDEIAEGLDFAHSHKVLHRDLKPANVLLDAEGHAVLTDFGFARLVADHSLSVSVSGGGMVGTPAYIAPEVWEGEPSGRPADLYALGCIVYEMASGVQPFTRATTPAVMRAHFQPLVLPARWPEGTPAGLGDVLRTALAQAPADRYTRAGELAAAVAGLTIDALAEPYATLQAAVAAGDWAQANALAGRIRAQKPDYRDVVALEAQALAGQEHAARVEQAATWRAEAEAALAQGDRSAAARAAKQWAGLTPDDPALAILRAQLAAPQALPAEPPAAAAGEQARQEALRQAEAEKAERRREAARIAEAEAAAAAQAGRQPEARPAVEQSRRLPLAAGGIALLVLVLALWHPWTGGARPEPTPSPTASQSTAGQSGAAQSRATNSVEPTQAPPKTAPPAAPADTPRASPTQAAPTSAPQALRVVLATDIGGIDDRSYNATVWQGVQSAAKDLGINGKYLEAQQQADYAKNIRQLVSEKLDLIVTVGFLMGVDTATAAKANPDQKFAIVDYTYPDCWSGAVIGRDCGSDTVLDNVLGLSFQMDEAAYLAGYLAAGMTNTGKVGTFGGLQIPVVTDYMKGFAAGVQHYNSVKDAQVEVVGWSTAQDSGVFIGNFESKDDGGKTAESMINDGVDIIMPIAGTANLGAAAACRQAGCMIIGVDTDVYLSAAEYRDVYLTSAIRKMDVAVHEVIRDLARGAFEGGVYVGALKNNGVGLAPFHSYDGKVPAALKAEIEKLAADIASGKISVATP